MLNQIHGSYYKFLKIQIFVSADTLFVVLTIPMVDKSLIFCLYKIYNLPLLLLNLFKPFHYKLSYKYFADMRYKAFPDGDNVIRCIVPIGYFCRLYNTLHQADLIIMNNNENVKSTARFLLLIRPQTMPLV